MAMDHFSVLQLFATGWLAPVMGLYIGLVVFRKAIMGIVPAVLHKLTRVEMFHMMVCSLLSLYTLVVLIYGQSQSGSVFVGGMNDWLLHGFAMFWVSKVYELFDVVLMVLQQQPRRITFINIYYRGTLPFIAFWAYFIHPQPAAMPILAINAAVHTFNYWYYFQPRALTSGVTKKGNWTQTRNVLLIEILQFFLMSSYVIYAWLYYSMCIYMVIYTAFLLVYYIYYYYSFMQYVWSKK